MKKKEKLKCPLCNSKFIPRTFYPEEAIFSVSDGKKLSGFNGYISSSGVKPTEVILGSWITYCPSCNYVMKFVKEIVKKEKIQTHNMISKNIKEKYNNYYFGFPFEDYSQYITKVAEKIKENIESSLEKLDLTIWENMYEIDDTFKLLVRFYANLENYCDSQISPPNGKDLPTKIKLLNLSSSLETTLLELNEVKNQTIHSAYELSNEDKEKINKVVINFTLNLIKKHIKPLIEEKTLKSNYMYADLRDIYSEIKVFISGYLTKIFNNGKSNHNQIRTFLETLVVN